MSFDLNKIYGFANFRLDVRERILSFDGHRIQITDKAFDLLCALLGMNGKLVSKDMLLSEVWHDSIVEENTLDKNISLLRRILGEKDNETKFIETVRGHGYRFVAEVTYDLAEAEGSQNGDTSLAPHKANENAGLVGTSAEGRELSVELGLTAEPRSSNGVDHKKNWIIVGLIVATTLVAAFFILRQIRSSSEGSTDVKRIAVLPLLNKTKDPNAQYLADGITEGIIDDLTHISGVKVMSRNSAFRFKDDQSDLHRIGKQLDVEFLVTGVINKVGDQFIVTVRLTDLSDDSQVWGTQYVKDAKDILSVQSEITSDVAQGLQVTLKPGEREAITRTPTSNAEAYRLYLLGRYHSKKATEDELVLAIDLYQKTLALDPKYSMALVGLADCYRTFAIAGWHMSSREAMERSREAATKALAIDSELAPAHAALAWTLYMYDQDWEGAEREFRKAASLSPDDADIRRGLAHMLSLAGRHNEAIAEGKLAVDLDPLSLLTNALYAQFLFYGGRTGEAVDQVNKTFAIEPNFWIAHNLLGRILLTEGRYPEALGEFQKARDFSGGGSIVPITDISYTYAKMGHREAALAGIREMESNKAHRFVPFYSFAIIYNGLGERDLALKYLERSVSEHEADAVFVKCNHRWDSYIGDARFDKLFKQMNFE